MSKSMVLLEHQNIQDGIDHLVQLKNQLKLIEKYAVGDLEWYLVFDQNDELWILREGVPVYRSEDCCIEETLQLWLLVCMSQSPFLQNVKKEQKLTEQADEQGYETKNNVVSHQHIRWVCTKCQSILTCRCSEEKETKHYLCDDCK